MTVTVAVPAVQVQAQFTAGTWTDISAFVQNLTVTRPVTRLQGPLWQYQAGTCQVQLDNSDSRFDPDNLAGPYISSTGLRQVVTTFGPGHAGNWVAPRNLSGTTIKVETWGPGDNGGTGAGPGGGGGEYAAENTYTVIPGNSYAYVAPSGPGSNTTFDGTGVVAHHAAGVTGGTGSTNSIHFNGGNGGAAGTGSPSAVGGGGGSSGGSASAGSNGTAGNSGGAGGVAVTGGYAGGLGAQNAYYPGQAGPGPGGGGGGGASGGTAGGPGGKFSSSRGGLGRGGQVRLTYFVTITPSATVSQVLPMVPVQVTATWPPAPSPPVAVLNPTAFQGLLTVPVTSGTVTVNWSVTLSGTVGAPDANNFQIELQNAGLPFGGFLFQSVNAGTAGTYVQGSFQLTIPSGGGPLALTVKGNTPTTGAIYGGSISVTYPLFRGFADSWQESPVTYEGGYSEFVLAATDGFGVLASNNLAATSILGAGDDSGARVTRLLDIAGWDPGMRQVDTGDSAQQGTVLGASALALLQLTADTEIGELYVNGAGTAVFRHRRGIISDARSNTPQGVFGDLPGTVQPAGTELALAAVGRADDNTTIANDIQITAAGSSNLQEAQDPVSEYIYQGARSYVRTDLLLSSDAEALQYANWVLFVSKNAENRFDTVTVDPQADTVSLYPQVLGREIGDRIQAWKRPFPFFGGQSGSVTSPAALTNIVFITVTPGAYTVQWSVTLSGTIAAAELNNFGLYNGSTLIAASVNPAAAGTYPQIPQAFTVTGGAPDVKILSGGTTPTTGAVYAAYAGSGVTKDVFVRGIAHSFDATSEAWQTIWTLQSAARYGNFLTLDSATLGLLDVDALAY